MQNAELRTIAEQIPLLGDCCLFVGYSFVDLSKMLIY